MPYLFIALHKVGKLRMACDKRKKLIGNIFLWRGQSVKYVKYEMNISSRNEYNFDLRNSDAKRFT